MFPYERYLDRGASLCAVDLKLRILASIVWIFVMPGWVCLQRAFAGHLVVQSSPPCIPLADGGSEDSSVMVAELSCWGGEAPAILGFAQLPRVMGVVVMSDTLPCRSSVFASSPLPSLRKALSLLSSGAFNVFGLALISCYSCAP